MHTARTSAWGSGSWLAHPVTVVALGLLLVNDHLLKRAYPGWLTGKLSDVAWLVVAPPLFATLVGATAAVLRRPVRPAVLAAVAIAVVGGAFAVVKTTVGGAAAASAVLSVVAGPSVVLRDPTDLIALPALAVVWAVGHPRRQRASAPVRPRGDRGWSVWWPVVVPLAVLATAATSQADDPVGVTDVDVVAGTLVIVDDYSTYATDDGRTWRPYEPPDGEAPGDSQGSPDNPDEEVRCMPDDTRECFRPAPDWQLGVQRSTDGGRTFRTEWSITPQEVLRLEEELEGDTQVWTSAVAILPTEEGHRVYAANRGDGLAVRHEDGTWERLGFPHWREPKAPVPIPGPRTGFLPAWNFAVPWWLIGAVATTAVVLLGAGRPRGPVRRLAGGRWVLSIILVSTAVVVNVRTRAPFGQELEGLVFRGPLLPTVVVAFVVVALVAALWAAASERGGAAVMPALLAGAAVGLALGLLPTTLLAAVVAVAIVPAGVAIARSRIAAVRPARVVPAIELLVPSSPPSSEAGAPERHDRDG